MNKEMRERMEKQYREALEENRLRQKKQLKKQDLKEAMLYILIFINVATFFIIMSK